MGPFAELGRDPVALVPTVAAGALAVRTTSRRWRAMRVRKHTRLWVDSIRWALTEEMLRDLIANES